MFRVAISNGVIDADSVREVISIEDVMNVQAEILQMWYKENMENMRKQVIKDAVDDEDVSKAVIANALNDTGYSTIAEVIDAIEEANEKLDGMERERDCMVDAFCEIYGYAREYAEEYAEQH